MSTVPKSQLYQKTYLKKINKKNIRKNVELNKFNKKHGAALTRILKSFNVVQKRSQNR